MQPLVLINAVGLTPRLLAHASRLRALAERGWQRPVRAVLPAVTCTAQATLLTGVTPDRHGIVGNGWLFRDTNEVRFWHQSNRLLHAEPLYVTLKKRHPRFRCAKLFWWFNQGAEVAYRVTPKPYYGADGNKVFGIDGFPVELVSRLERALGPFPFPSFWGPLAGLPSTEWIARCAADVVRTESPDLTLVYLPHLDYDLQRFDPRRADAARLVGELDRACEPLLDAARQRGSRVWVVSEYGHVPVRRAVLVNRVLRQANLLVVREGPFGETLDTFQSEAFAVCDHQLAHVYVKDRARRADVAAQLASVPGVGSVALGPARAELGLNHDRAGDLVLLAEEDAWFAYPYWLDEARAPDFARTVDIHRKPGYDPCELLLDPGLRLPRLRLARRWLRKKLGMRTLFDVVPLDPELIRGSHGLVARESADGPILIGDGPAPDDGVVPMESVHGLLLHALDTDARHSFVDRQG